MLLEAGPRASAALLLAAAGSLGAIVALELPPSPRIMAIPAPVVLPTFAVTSVVAGLVLWTSPVRWAVGRLWLPYATAAVAIALAAWGWWATVVDRFAGFPGVRPVMFTVSMTFVTAGLTLSSPAARRTARAPTTQSRGLPDERPALTRSGARAAWPVAAVAATVLIAALAVSLVPPVVAEERMGSARAAEPVASPAAVAWQRRFPDLVDAVAIAGTMVAVVRAGGEVVAIDGVTGRTRWRYTRRYAHVPPGRARVAPDGRSLVVVFGSGPKPGGADVAVVLDAITGRERWHRAGDRPLVGVTDGVVLFGERKSRYLFAHDVDSGRMRWQWATPSPPEIRCRLDSQPVAAFPDRIAVASRCEGLGARQIRTYVIAERDASVLSSFDYDQSGDGRFALYSAPASLLLVAVRGSAAGSEYHLIDAGTGERVAAFTDPDRTLLSVDDRGLLWRRDREDVVTDLRGQRSAALPPVPGNGCAPQNAAWTGTHLVVLCAGPDRPPRVVTKKLDGTAEGLVELPEAVGSRLLSGADSGGPQASGGVELVGRGAGRPGLSAGATVVLDRPNGILLGLG
jgi:hypothetical protein